jgi:transcriptional regulator with XRE-family HTH domain
MATMLAPMDARDVVRCDECGLVQFVPRAGLSPPCRRCHVAFDYQDSPAPGPTSVPAHHHMTPSTQPPTAIRTLRRGLGISQRQLAKRMIVPRTWVSKIENEKATPTLSSVERLARALEVTVPELLSGGERSRQDEICELVKDPFVAEILPYISRLSRMQMSSILSQVQYRSRSRAAAAA